MVGQRHLHSPSREGSTRPGRRMTDRKTVVRLLAVPPMELQVQGKGAHHLKNTRHDADPASRNPMAAAGKAVRKGRARQRV